MQGRGPIEHALRRWLPMALLALLVAYAAWHWPAWRLRANMAAGYGARMACSCRYIEGRDIASCRSDFRGLEGMWMVRLADEPDGKLVRASVPLMAAREARFRDGFGCLPDRP